MPKAKEIKPIYTCLGIPKDREIREIYKERILLWFTVFQEKHIQKTSDTMIESIEIKIKLT